MTNLERAALQSQMNPHFIFNSLNSIQKFIINNEKEEASEYLAKFAMLIRYNLKSSNSKEIPLKDELALLEIYIGLERIRFKNKFNVDIINNLTISPEQILIPPMLIQPVVENAILHGIADIQEKGLIKIVYYNDDKKIYIKVSDNGKGLTLNQITKEQSDGSRITKRRLELINNQSQSNYTLTNDVDVNGNIIGAIAHLEITYRFKN